MERAWRQMERQHEAPATAAQDSVLRLALGLLAADVRAAITPAQRQWIIDRLWPIFRPEEKEKLKEPLLGYLRTYRPSIVEIVERQFCPRGEETR